MRIAIFNQERGVYFSRYATQKEYFLFNEVGAQIYRMSKGKICNRGMKGSNKYKP